MPSTEQDSALITQAAIQVCQESGMSRLPVALPAPLPEGRRQYLYTVSDAHPLKEVYGAGPLSAILIETKTAHLADRSPRNGNSASGQKSTRHGLRYCDRHAALDERLVPFTSDEAKKAWRQEAEQRRREQHAVVQAAGQLTGTITSQQAQALLPDPKDTPGNLQEARPGAISVPKTAPSPRDNSR